jgi:pimeloyl-ACP methyl ester carboxylesterase
MSAWVTTPDGLELAVDASGNPQGPTMLLVHGYPDTHEVWNEVCAELGDEFRLVRYDVRGAGQSGTPACRAGYELDRLADDLFAVADWAGGPVHLVAHDWGSIQAWHAVTDPRAAERILSFTSISGPSLDHVGRWFRRRLRRPTPRNLTELGRQFSMSWYIGVFQLPVLAPAVWRLRLARRWPQMLRALEGVPPRDGYPAQTLLSDALNGIELYRANMFRRISAPQPRQTSVPVQVVALTRDHYVSQALTRGLEELAPALTRRTLDATHWSALTVQAKELATMIRDFARHPSAPPIGADGSLATLDR